MFISDDVLVLIMGTTTGFGCMETREQGPPLVLVKCIIISLLQDRLCLVLIQ